MNPRFTHLIFCPLVFAIGVKLNGQGVAPAQLRQDEGRISLTAVDAASGFALSGARVGWAKIADSIPNPLPNAAMVNTSGIFDRYLAPGHYVFEITAHGYVTARTHFLILGNSTLQANIDLTGVNLPPELQPELVSRQLRPGLDFVHGFVVDEKTRHPLSGAEVRIGNEGSTTLTDGRGYFELYADAENGQEAVRAEELPALGSITVKAPGYKSHVIDGLIFVPNSDSGLKVSLERGTGVTREHIVHRPIEGGSQDNVNPSTVPPISKALSDWLGGHGTAYLLGPSGVVSPQLASSILVPSSIRVGSDCPTSTTCTTITRYDFETYVQDGLNGEWLAGWNAESLKAGAVAYRSYAAWYVQHPKVAISAIPQLARSLVQLENRALFQPLRPRVALFLALTVSTLFSLSMRPSQMGGHARMDLQVKIASTGPV
ncbi:MAG: SpoIID/LytB domain-containing protein [Acidobacteriaceae bacterium]